MKIATFGLTSAAVWAPLLCLVVGCGTQTFKHPPVPLSGVVKMDGEPIANVEVEFISDSGLSAIGLTNAAGEFELAKSEYGDGIPPETYHIWVRGQGDVQLPIAYEEENVKTVVVEPGNNQSITIDLDSKAKPGELGTGQVAQQ